MATKRSKPKLTVDGHGDVHKVTEWPKIIKGSHSTRIEHQDGTVEFHTDWDALQRDVKEAIAEYERKKLVKEAPYHPGYEGAVVELTKPARTRKAKKT